MPDLRAGGLLSARRHVSPDDPATVSAQRRAVPRRSVVSQRQLSDLQQSLLSLRVPVPRDVSETVPGPRRDPSHAAELFAGPVPDHAGIVLSARLLSDDRLPAVPSARRRFRPEPVLQPAQLSAADDQCLLSRQQPVCRADAPGVPAVERDVPTRPTVRLGRLYHGPDRGLLCPRPVRGHQRVDLSGIRRRFPPKPTVLASDL